MKKPKIKYSFTYINLKNWLKYSQHRFPIKPNLTRLRRNSFSLVFPRVDNLEVIFKTGGEIEVWVWKDKNYVVDILVEFDLYENKNEHGYYCQLCEPREYYQDRQILWEKNVYEPLLEWTINNFKPENYLCLFEIEPKGSSWARILPVDKTEKDKDFTYRIYCEPVIRQERNRPTK